MRARDNLKRQFNQSKCPVLFKKYQALRNAINIACRKNKQRHFHDLFNKSNESKDLWFAYKQLTSTNYKSTKIDQLQVDDELTNCPKKICKAIAESVIIKPETLDNLDIPQLPSSEEITPIFPLEVNKTIRKMKPKKSLAYLTSPPAL